MYKYNGIMLKFDHHVIDRDREPSRESPTDI